MIDVDFMGEEVKTFVLFMELKNLKFIELMRELEV